MSALLPELAPVTLRALLIPLGTLVLFATARGLIAAADALVRGLFGTLSGAVGWIPFLNRVVQAPIHTIEHKLIDLLARAANGADGKISAALHSLEALVSQLARDVAAAAVFDWNLVKWVEAHTNPGYLYRSIRSSLLTLRHVRALVAAGAATAVRPLITRISRLDTWTHARIRALQHTIAVTIPADLAGLRKRTRSVEDDLEAAWAKIK